jgi:hypothetical protein
LRLGRWDRFAADVGSTVIVVAAAMLVLAVKTNFASAQSTPDDENRVAPATVGEPTADTQPQNQSQAERDAALLSAAVRPAPQLPAIRWSDAGDAVSDWAQPELHQAEQFAGKYGSRLGFQVIQHNGESQAQVQLALGGPDHEAPAAPTQVRLGGAPAPRAILKKKAHWYLFAAGGSNAVGMNLFRDPSGELRRAGWTFEHIAAVGTGQVGLGWRKGPLQASLGLVERQLSSYGQTVHEQFLAFSISISPQGTRTSGPARSWIQGDDHYRGRYAQH